MVEYGFNVPCYKPITGYRSKYKNANGKRSLVFSAEKSIDGKPIDIGCGQCIGCRLERSRQWAMRCVHEAALYQDNSFITLTYNNHYLPEDGSLDITDYQKFMKRLRKKHDYKKIRFFHCGEYGETKQRPHYHAILFNHDFKDKTEFGENNGHKIYVSGELAELWPFGYSSIGNVTFESAAYVARYVMKKVTGERAEEHYKGRAPEYVTMSRNPGIGNEWFKKFKQDCFPKDYMTINGKRCQPPKYYDNLYEVEFPEEMEELKLKRQAKAKNNKDNSLERLESREKVKKRQLGMLRRKVE